MIVVSDKSSYNVLLEGCKKKTFGSARVETWKRQTCLLEAQHCQVVIKTSPSYRQKRVVSGNYGIGDVFRCNVGHLNSFQFEERRLLCMSASFTCYVLNMHDVILSYNFGRQRNIWTPPYCQYLNKSSLSTFLVMTESALHAKLLSRFVILPICHVTFVTVVTQPGDHCGRALWPSIITWI